MFSVLVIRLRSLRLLRVSGIVMRLRMFLLLITFLKASHSFRNRLLVICKNAYLFATMRSEERFAGMPRPISYAVFCLKKKKTENITSTSIITVCEYRQMLPRLISNRTVVSIDWRI